MVVFSVSRYAKAVLYSIPFVLFVEQALANDFPTVDRALFIQECMALENSHKYETLYACSCKLDKIAAEMSYREFVEADSYQRMSNMRGERGGLFRSGNKQARDIRKHYSQIKTRAEAACFPQQTSPHSAADSSRKTDNIQKR